MSDTELPSKAKVIAIKRNVLQIIETLLEETSTEWVLENCTQLCQADYDDVIQERSIEHMCGYPICSKPIKTVTRQKYHISANKVYDITQRKNFCSNECYKASNFLKNQLHTLPMYLRKPNESTVSLKLLSESDNKGSAGEELVFHRSISQDEIEDKTVEVPVSTNLNSMLQEDIKDCAEHLADLKIKEKIFSDKYVFGTEDEEKVLKEETDGEDSESSGSEISDTDKKLFPEYGNPKALSNKHMPVSDNMKKAVLINPIRVTNTSTSDPSKFQIEFISKIFLDWFSEDTMKYLLGERQVYSVKADQLFKTLVSTPTNAEELDSIKSEYVNLCIKIDKLPDEEEEEEIDGFPKIEENISRFRIGNEMAEDHKEEVKNLTTKDVNSVPTKKNPVRRKIRKSPNKSKSVSFSSDVKSGAVTAKKEPDATTVSEPTIPLVDSLSQNTLRKQVLMAKFKKAYVEVLSVIELHYRFIKEEVTAMVDTFSLTPTNVIYKPQQMKCIALVLYRILTITKLKELHDDSQFVKLCESSLKALNISHQEVDNLAMDLINPNQVLRLHKN